MRTIHPAIATVAERLFYLVATALLIALSPAVSAAQSDSPTYPNAQLLVNTEWVIEHMNDPMLRIIDMQAPAAYREAHIPGAVNVPVSEIAPTVDALPMEFDEEAIQTTLNRSGLTPEMTVVIYDNFGMMDSARLFWTLEYVGHEDVRILDGGWNAWNAAGGETTSELPEYETSEYPIELEEAKLITADEILERLDDPALVIVDARSEAEYTGEFSFSDRAGHIPGAVLFSWFDALTGGDTLPATERGWQDALRDEDVEVFRPASELEMLLSERGITPDQEVVTYCQTFWRGAHVYFALRLMGFENVRGYDGSWAEWGNRDDLPIE